MKFWAASGIALTAITLSVSVGALAQDADRDPLVDTVGNGKGRINYSAGTIKATGYGAPPSSVTSGSQARLMALGAAKADALRNLAMAVSAVQVTSKTKVKNYVLESDTVETKLSAMLQSPRVISEKIQRDGTAEVVVELPLYGPGSVAEAILPEVIREGREEREERGDRGRDRDQGRDREGRGPDTITPGAPVSPKDVELKPNPGDNFKEPRAPATQIATGPRIRPIVRPNVEAGLTPSDDRGPFSAIVLDCRGLGLRATLAPKLYDATGRELYGTVSIDPDFAIETGIVGYPRTMYDALRSRRAGNHPLIVKAVRVERGGTDPVVSFDDAERILSANKRDRFFEKTRVIFLCDPVR
jgi:hypothetical protein